MLIADKVAGYELLDGRDGEKLERWGDALLLRPDPQAIWPAGEPLAHTPGLAGIITAHLPAAESGRCCAGCRPSGGFATAT